MDKIYAVVECEGGFTSTINIKTVEEKRKSLDKYLKWVRRFKLHSKGNIYKAVIIATTGEKI